MIVTEEQARAFCANRLSPLAMERLDHLSAALREESTRQNLVSTDSLDNVWVRHFADSAQLVDFGPRETGPWVDLGSGAGFPGLVLAIAQPGVDTVLIESRKRRVEWLMRCVHDLQLANCRILGSKLENIETFEAAVITARAFAPLEKLLRLSARFSTSATMWLLPKGRSAAQDLAGQPSWVRGMFHVKQSQVNHEAGILIGRGVARAP
ncbi:MAG: 16S rRNA (guanine(527)-N(7))-methyltransferase RsmG [Croceibacterium sp.]